MSGRRLRVLFVAAWYPTPTRPHGGVFVREHAKAVSLRDHVRVIHILGQDTGLTTPHRFEKDEVETAAHGIDVYRLRFRPGRFGSSVWARIRAVRAAIEALKTEEFVPDVIHAHIFTAGFPTVLAALPSRTPVLVTEQWSAIPRGTLRLHDRAQASVAYSLAARTLPVSEGLRRSVAKLAWRRDFALIPNVVDTSRFYPREGPSEAPFKILCVANLVPVKGVPILVEAAALLLQRRRDWTLDIVGDGEQRADLESHAAHLGLGEHVRFWGHIPKEQVAERMRESDLFALTSHWDSMPSVLVEALASGLPIVATRVGGIPEIVTSGLGWLAEPGEPMSVADRLERALDELPKIDRDDLAAIARERYSYESVGQRLHALYEEALA